MRFFIYPLIEKTVSFLYKTIKPDLQLFGLRRLNEKNTMYIANHFTNIETILLPYLFLEKNNIKTRSLAKNELFTKNNSSFLNHIGAFSTNYPKRNELIVHDLVHGKYNWFIYPEGIMVKNKKVINENNELFLDIPTYKGPPRTGAIFLSIESYIFSFFIQKYKKNKKKISILKKINTFDIDEEKIADDIHIQPITITYYPLRSKDFILKNIVKKMSTSSKQKDELTTELSYLFKGTINIYIHNSISLKKYLFLPLKFFSYFLTYPLVHKLMMNFYLKAITFKSMFSIYKHIFINIDHLVIYYLFCKKGMKFDLEHLKDFLIVSSLQIRYVNRRNYNFTLTDKLFYIYTEKEFKPFNKIISFCKNNNLIVEKENSLWVNATIFKKKHLFDQIRQENPFQVILNEFKPLFKVRSTIKPYTKKNLTSRVFDKVLLGDKLQYISDYNRFYDSQTSKDISIGKPVYHKKNKKIAVVLCHGYLASPAEMSELAKLLQKDYTTYQVRLRGHGTSHSNLNEITHQDWVASVLKVVIALKKKYSEVNLVGFSTGGTISLYLNSITKDILSKTILINPAIKLVDKRSKFVHILKYWNNVSDRLNINKRAYEKIENNPTYPDTNYQYNTIDAVIELKKMIEKTERHFKKVSSPLHIIQSSDDTIVDSKGTKTVFDQIPYLKKTFYEIKTDQHVIVRGEYLNEVYQQILTYLR